MNEELLNTFYKINKLSSCELRKYDNSKIILQYGGETLELNFSTFQELLKDDVKECEKTIRLFDKLKYNQYVIVAYYEGKILSSVKTITDD